MFFLGCLLLYVYQQSDGKQLEYTETSLLQRYIIQSGLQLSLKIICNLCYVDTSGRAH
jgi:hypothetical protein